jgi:integrase
MATITKLQRPDGVVYKARIRRNGTQGETSRTFKTRNAAERWARKVESSIEQDDAGLVSVAQKHTLTDAIDRYRREILPGHNPSTIPNYTRHLTYWDNALGHLRLSDVTAARIAACRDDLATLPMAGKTPESVPACRTPATVRRYLATLAAVLSACQKHWHWLADSPMRQVSKPSENNARSRFLSEDELHRLLTACQESKSPDLLLAVMLAVTTGARQGEILGLRWKDIDLTAGVLRLRVDNETTTKGGVRSLPIVSQVRPLLQDRLAAYRQGKVADLTGSDLVFPSRVSLNRPVQLRKPFETALERAGIKDFVWHDLRHSAASFMAANGASLLEIGAVLGHKCAQTTARYSHLTEQASHALVRGTADKLLGSL